MKFKYLLAASVAGFTGAVVLPAPVMAQQITSGVEGTVLAEDGTAIPGATVVVKDERTGAARTVTTSMAGSFRADSLTTGGPYTITVTAPGYEGQSLPDQTISLQGNTAFTFRLSPAAGEENVIVVSGSRVQVTQLAVGPGTSFGEQLLETAPTFNRDIRDVLRLDPRVNLARDDLSGQDRISCLGGNDRSNAFTIDGISQSDVYGLNDNGFASRSSAPLPYDAVRETQVQFAPFDVDYGNFTGCAINVVTKSGSNDYHFGGFFEYSDNGMRGKKVADQTVGAIEPEKRYGFYLSGPVIRDRLFLFGAYEHQEAGGPQEYGPRGSGAAKELGSISQDQFDEVSEILSRVYGVETGPVAYSLPYENDRYFVRGDLQINDDHRLEATYQHLEEQTVKTDDFFTSTSSSQLTGVNTFYNSGTKSDYYSVRLYSQWSDMFSTEARYSRSEVTDKQDPIGGYEAQGSNPTPRIIVGIDNPTGPDGTILAGPGLNRSANSLSTGIDQFRFAGRLDAGNHQLKFGAELNRAAINNLYVFNATGTLVFRNVEDLRDGVISPGLSGNGNTSTTPANVIPGNTAGAFASYTPTGDVTTAAAAFKRDIWSVFAQDEWQATDALSLTAGVRVDWYDTNEQPALNPNFVARYGFPNTTSFSNLDPVIMPRLAATYDLDDFGAFSRAQLRAGVGVFSGGDPLVWFGNAYQNNGANYGQTTSNDAACAGQDLNVLQGGQFTGIPQCVLNSAAAQGAAGLADTQSIDPDLKMPTVIRANLGFASDIDFAEEGLFSAWHVNVDYIYSRYRNPLSVVDLSQTVNPARGVDGYTIDGRPIYAAIDPTRSGCDATLVDAGTVTWEGVTASCFGTSRDDEIMLTNAGSYSSQIASFILSRHTEGGLFTPNGSVDFSFGYAFTDSNDRRNMYNSTATSNYDYVAAFNRQNPEVSRGFYGSKHNFSVNTSFKEEFFADLATRLNVSFVASSGRPYSLTFTGGGVFNDSASGNDNALLYIPAGLNDANISPSSNASAVEALYEFTQGLGCAKKYAGSTIARNTCENDWYFDVDLSLSQELPGPGRLFGRDDKLKVYAMFDNFLNFLDKDWNVSRRRNFAGVQDMASLSGIDSEGRYIISAFNTGAFDSDNEIKTTASVWRLKIGVSYDF
ncbi:TonB-dependent receptor [Croceicoccus sp. BE223]|uniref:TonB-dependent receptor n=1 Tax=Croceicoccus sp. BE223 TaxID=2817716 RepID=UPI002857C1DD|nr:TonB-dependent receptor [Croceicoccus sp. BE223]MDR7101680.1 outer membrane receptor protein involved in Fe transport [Croceicoccus sp. BE223]